MTKIIILITAIFFWLAQNSYFGWNAMPKSPEELICDGITIALFCMCITVEN